MAPSYDVSQYLLDRANIHDTIAKVPLYYDTRNLDALEAEVYADEVFIDYTSIFGGEPYTLSRGECVKRVGAVLDGMFSSTQHVTSGIIANLPQPTANATRPDRVAVYAQVAANLVGKSSADGTLPLTQNGGMLEAEVRRDPELEKQGVNPWRITKYIVIKRWDRGNTTVLDYAKE
ncbi:hypothetical protein VTK56DRAFT_8025 [Thermocarpiscus australiensis]